MRVIFLLIFATLLFANCKDENGKQRLKKEFSKLKKIGQINGLDNPEAIAFNPSDQVLYISNNAKNKREITTEGFISKVGLDGKIIDKHLIDSIMEPNGLIIFKNKLYITSGNELISAQLNNAKIHKRIKLDEKGHRLNDLVILGGSLFISDGACGCIYKLTGDERLDRVYSGLQEPHGMAVKNDTLYYVSSKKGTLNRLQPKGKTTEEIVQGLGFAHGITHFNKGFLISDWEGGLFYINENFNKKRLTDTRKKHLNTTGLWYDKNTNKVYVTTLYGDKALIYEPQYKNPLKTSQNN